MKTASLKAKGRLAQQGFRDMILDAFPHLAPDDVRSTPMGSMGEDLLLSPLARHVLPYDVEAKSRASIAVYKWLEQRSKGTYPPLVFAKANRKKPICILFAEDFIELLCLAEKSR